MSVATEPYKMILYLYQAAVRWIANLGICLKPGRTRYYVASSHTRQTDIEMLPYRKIKKFFRIS